MLKIVEICVLISKIDDNDVELIDGYCRNKFSYEACIVNGTKNIEVLMNLAKDLKIKKRMEFGTAIRILKFLDNKISDGDF